MNVAFVNMPFGAIRPAIGVSLLKSHLANMGVSSQILYLNMRFARKLGLGSTNTSPNKLPARASLEIGYFRVPPLARASMPTFCTSRLLLTASERSLLQAAE